jgi:Zn ribbon nucleic-acid-binding protein
VDEFDEELQCPKCGKASIAVFGLEDGLKAFQCIDCGYLW